MRKPARGIPVYFDAEAASKDCRSEANSGHIHLIVDHAEGNRGTARYYRWRGCAARCDRSAALG